MVDPAMFASMTVKDTPYGRKAFAHNMAQFMTTRHVGAIAAGALTGAMKCESWTGGFLMYASICLFLVPTVYILTVSLRTRLEDSARLKGQNLPAKFEVQQSTVGRYFVSPWYLYKSGCMTGLMSFVLMWTISYNVSYVF